ncbi:MAG: DUF86 domain-containing protein [Acidobacteria bacterium]|nr:DUF86 domain-containing protein [Acidobacteriota bacterium]
MSPGRPDPLVIRRHLLALRLAVANLQRHCGATAEELAADPDLAWAVERGLQLCAQNAIDLATHVAVSSGRDIPDYAAAIDALAELGVIPRDFAAAFRGIAGFRNILVHGYLEVDLSVVSRLLNERLGDFIELADHMERFLANGLGEER